MKCILKALSAILLLSASLPNNVQASSSVLDLAANCGPAEIDPVHGFLFMYDCHNKQYPINNPDMPTATTDSFLNSLTLMSVAVTNPGSCQSGTAEKLGPWGRHPRLTLDRYGAASRLSIGETIAPIILSTQEGVQTVKYAETFGNFKKNKRKWTFHYIGGNAITQQNALTSDCIISVDVINYLEFAPLYQYIKKMKQHLKEQLATKELFHQLYVRFSAWGELQDMLDSDIPDRIELISDEMSHLESYQEDWTFEEETKYNDLLDNKAWFEDLQKAMKKASKVASLCADPANAGLLGRPPVYCINEARTLHTKMYHHIQDEAKELKYYRDYLQSEIKRLDAAKIDQTNKLQNALQEIKDFFEGDSSLQWL